MQFYKGDENELKYYEAGAAIMDAMVLAKNEFFNDAFECFLLGELIWDSGRSPLSNAIPRAVFRESFSDIFETFLQAGSLEAYLTIFDKIFGETVAVTFTVPAPGRLQIGIVAEGSVISNLDSREIVSNAYVFHDLITQDGDNIVIQTVKGLESAYEVQQMLFELVPSGIFTEITLTMGP